MGADPRGQKIMLSTWHLLILALIVLLLFGGSGKISSLMGDFAKGIKSFKKGLSEEDEPKKDEPGKVIEHKPADVAVSKSGETTTTTTKTG